MSFNKKLQDGKTGEGIIAKWLNMCGWNVLPAYEIELQTGKGPQLFTATRGQLITPDMLVFKGNTIAWIEAKTKSAFTWHRNTKSFQTGIDKKHWEEYLKVNGVAPFPIWILFLHKSGNNAKDTPNGMFSPSGLYGQEIIKLKYTIDHYSDRWGLSGMVYWQEKSLVKICEFDDVVSLSSGPVNIYNVLNPNVEW